ncbi:MAG: DUF3539 family protein [Coleofasciculaceae cyanobacterium SM2_3_26]|nr:DUF3539 family protein [Coleofasciculaceae cyanobacterium SM2_3_26]
MQRKRDRPSDSEPNGVSTVPTTNGEIYINHPNFGLLFRVCLVDGEKELFTTLYAQRLFFQVNAGATGALSFVPISRGDARLMVENRMRELRRAGRVKEYEQLLATHKRTFQ